MIEAGLYFNQPLASVLASFDTLPDDLKPEHFSTGEKVASKLDQVIDRKRFASFISRSKSGFFLLGRGLTYSIRLAANEPVLCDCFLDVRPEAAETFMRHMAEAVPEFGYACLPEEREARNRLVIHQGTNKIESWVGRDARRHVPGLYWLTLMSGALLRSHGVSEVLLDRVSVQHSKLPADMHLYRFYTDPKSWADAQNVLIAMVDLPGVFDIRKVKAVLPEGANFLEVSAFLRTWR